MANKAIEDALKKYNETYYKKAINKELINNFGSELKKYTSLLEESAEEYSNCKNCKSIQECKNKVEGCCFIPINYQGNLTFTYMPCKYKKAMDKKNKHLNNVKFFNTPEYIKEASLNKIYKTDKNRFEVINWLMDFLEDFEKGNKVKVNIK